jgi:hypothetical protein
MGKLFEAIVSGKNLKEDIEADYQAAQFRAESVVKSFMKDYSPKMTRMAFEKAFNKLCESTNLKEATDDSYGFHTRDGDNETVYDKFGNYYQLDMWFIGEATPYKSYQEAVDDFRSGCLVDSGIDDDLRKEGVTDIDDYAESFTDFAISICPNYVE